jgi:NADPH-dependent 2,4-dienoyl-CoA reductase/sulfur reductase-like enzyme
MTSSRTVVIGAGPAGLAASAELLNAGLTVTLIDAGAHWGGQFWRHPAGPLEADLHHDVSVYQSLAADLERFIANGSLTYLARHHVWSVEVDEDNTDLDSGGAVHAIDRTDPSAPTDTAIRWDYLVLAVGAYDRQLPFPGWDLPGVMTIGGVQALLKGNGVAVGPRVLVAGTGPFLLPVATALAAKGSTVVGVHEANHPIGWLRHAATLVHSRRHLREAAGYATALLRYRVRLQHRSMVVAAHGDDRLEAVTVAKLDRHGNKRVGTERRIAVDVLAVGYGFTAQAELAIAAGCEMHATGDLTLTVVADENQRTSRPRVFAAGEITGIGGAQLAVAEGRAAGAAIARRSRPDERAPLRRFAQAMHSVYPVPPAWLSNVQPDTVICRCEEITVAEIDAAIELGARDNRTVKLLSRAGMGWCQGRECAFATACLTADRTGRTLDLASGAARPIASPVPLGIVATTAE